MSEPFVRPDVRAFLTALEDQPRPLMTREVLARIRRMPSDSMAGADLPIGQLGEMRDLDIAGPGGPLALRLFDPRAEGDRGPGPVVVFFHGGGFIVGGIGSHAGLSAEIARQLDLPVVSVEYRLAPEHPWPAAPDDAEAATRWIVENGDAFGRTFTGLVLFGDSAGGTLSLVTALALRDRPAALPLLLQVPIYPAADRGAGNDFPSFREFADGYGLESGNMQLYDAHYAADFDHWRATPRNADLAGLPPMLLVTAGLDPLRDDGRAFAAAAIGAGVRTTYVEIAGTIHGFATYRGAIPSARGDLARILTLARAMLAETP